MEVAFGTFVYPDAKNNATWRKYASGDLIRTDRIGEEIDFVRFGNLPENGKSKIWITFGPPYKSFPELAGVSVFEFLNGFFVMPTGYPKDLFQRPALRGRGSIVGWGPDGEPLVRILEISENLRSIPTI